ncbi:hypothetical protein H6504_01915 [Candidatus Woesearchaeota archaeon]|nr:hypothetical protein [Candidatus Woesearchaeota archaeon]
MKITDIYQIGQMLPLGMTIESVDTKMQMIYFPYTSKDIVATSVAFFLGTIFLYMVSSVISPILSTMVFFMGMIATAVAYVYPVSILYSQEIMDYQEQMFKAILGMSNYISMKTSLEYALIETTDQVRGVLQKEFIMVKHQLERREKSSFGDALKQFIPKWNRINQVFVKTMRLLEAAAISSADDMETTLREINRTLMTSYRVQGKRSAEELAAKANTVISFGVLFPVISLMLLPLLSVFLTDLIKSWFLIFAFNVFFPVIMVLIVLDFANKRIQIDTIRLEESPGYQKMPVWVYIFAGAIFLAMSVPAVMHLSSIDMSNDISADKEYSFIAILLVWMMPFGAMIAINVVAYYYIYLHEETWTAVKDIEDDLPFVLHYMSTALALNTSVEKMLPNIASDYRSEGMGDHAIVKLFTEISHRLMYTKGRIETTIKSTLRDMCPSLKTTNILSVILSFARISERGAAKAARLIRDQLVSIIELDDYIRTLLSDTLSLINMGITMLLPLLSAVTVLMAVMIVKSLRFLMDQLASIEKTFGGTGTGFNLVDITKIIPPTVLEVIVSLYFVEMYLILTLFMTKIEIGNDKYKFAKKLLSNTTGFIIFTIILLAGHYMMNEVFFKTMMA